MKVAARRIILVAAIWSLCLALTSTGCHPISKSVREEADQDLPFAALRHDPDKYRGTTVLLGGTIVRTEDRQKETLVEVHQKRLGMYSEPRKEGETGGRFLVVYPGLLDPSIYREGRRITVGGEVVGKEVKKPNDSEEDYLYPVVRAQDIHLWSDDGYGYYPYSIHYRYGYGGYHLHHYHYGHPRYYFRCY